MPIRDRRPDQDRSIVAFLFDFVFSAAEFREFPSPLRTIHRIFWTSQSFPGWLPDDILLRRKAKLLGPWGSLAAFLKRVLVNSDSPLTVFSANEGLTSPTHKPEPSQNSPSETQLIPEPTTTKVLEDVAQIIAPELEPKNESDQVCEPPVTVGILMEYKGKEEGPAHIPAAEGELQLASVDLPSLFDPLFSSAPPSLVSLSSSLVSPSHESIEFLLVPSSPKSSVSPLVLSSPESDPPESLTGLPYLFSSAWVLHLPATTSHSIQALFPSSTAVRHPLCTPLSQLSPMWVRIGASYHQLWLGVRFPCLCLQSQDPALHLGPSTLRLCLGS